MTNINVEELKELANTKQNELQKVEKAKSESKENKLLKLKQKAVIEANNIIEKCNQKAIKYAKKGFRSLLIKKFFSYTVKDEMIFGETYNGILAKLLFDYYESKGLMIRLEEPMPEDDKYSKIIILW